jgi:hypothetical protein
MLDGRIRVDRCTSGGKQLLEQLDTNRENHHMITVQQLKGEEWEVTVTAGTTTRHRVRVTKSDLERFGGGASAEDLLLESFRFLLEREPHTAILGSFDLPVISTYFPEYDKDILKRLSAG